MTFPVRPYKPTDLDAIQSLTAELWPVPLEREFFWASTPRESEAWPAVWVAEQGGRLLGFSRLDKNDYLPSETLAFCVVNVQPNAQGRGIGRALTREAEAYAAAHGQTTLRTSARTDLTRLTRFWQARGFHEVLRGGPLMVWEGSPPHTEHDFQLESLEAFTTRPDAAALLESVLNRWNRLIHEGLPFPAAGHLSGAEWLETLREAVELKHSRAVWDGGTLRGLIVFSSWEARPDELALNLDFTCDALSPDHTPLLPLNAVACVIAEAFATGVRRVVFEAQPHFPWAVNPLAQLNPVILERPVWVLMDKELTVPAL